MLITNINSSASQGTSSGQDYFAESVASAEVENIIAKLNKLIKSLKDDQTAFGNLTLKYAGDAAKDIFISGIIAGGISAVGAAASGVTGGSMGSQIADLKAVSTEFENSMDPVRQDLSKIDNKITNINQKLESNNAQMVFNENQAQPKTQFKSLSLKEKIQITKEREGLQVQRKPHEEKASKLNDTKAEKVKEIEIKTQRVYQLGTAAQGIAKIGEVGTNGFQGAQTKDAANKDISNNMYSSAQSTEGQIQAGVDSALRINVFAAAVAGSKA